MEIVIAAIALLLGLALGFIISNTKTSSLKTRVGILESQLDQSQKAFEERQKEAEDNHKRVVEDMKRLHEKSSADKDRMHAETISRQEKHEKESLEALQGRFDETVAKMKAELENITAEMLKKRQTEFIESSAQSVSHILEPLNNNISEMRKAVSENTVHHSKLGGELSNNLQLVMRHSDLARQSAERLAEALRGGGKVQGDWGETILTELLESQGLKEGVHFHTQSTLTDEKGRAKLSEDTHSRMRPDVILHLDKDRDVIIDAKVSLSAFIDYVNAENEEIRSLALKRHIESIEKHVKELSKKDYSSYVGAGKTRMNYVIMFVPTTAALYVATTEKSDLWRKAMENNVYIADEQTLYAALRIIDMTWRQIAQAENHEKVYKLADEMLDRVVRFVESFTAIGTKLDDASKAYKDAFAKLDQSGQSIPNTCRKLVKMGAKPKKLPKSSLGVSVFLPSEETEDVSE